MTKKISIHAPHEGERQIIPIVTILIRAPHEGERQIKIDKDSQKNRFQSTLPTRGSDDYDMRQRP